MRDRRVVITGVGVVSPLGNNFTETWKNILQGRSGIKKITAFDSSTFRSQIAGIIEDFDYKEHYPKNFLSKANRLDKFVHYAVSASNEALTSSSIDISKHSESIGVCIGSGIGGLDIQIKNGNLLRDKGHKKVSPFYVSGFIGNMASGVVSMLHHIKGPNFALQSACATANHSVASGFMCIKNGMAKAMVTGGSEGALIEMALAGFDNMRALSSNYNDEPTRASRPFDRDRDGFVISEGAGVLVLEDYDFAKNRGANIICELVSVGMSGDGYDMVMPDPEGNGAYRSMKMCLDLAGIKADDIGYINTHGTSTSLGDLAESEAIRRLINDDQSNLTVGSTKSMLGHSLGAVAGIEAAITSQVIAENKIPPTINLENLDEKIKLNCINTKVVEKPVHFAISNSFGFGGHNSSICLKSI